MHQRHVVVCILESILISSEQALIATGSASEVIDRFSGLYCGTRGQEQRRSPALVSVCHDRGCAQEAVQDAFLSMWSSRATYDPTRGTVVAWAMNIVHHRAIYLARRRSVAYESDEEAARLEGEPSREDVPADFAAHAETEQLTELLARLPPAQREVIRLGFFDGLSHQEIARRLALPSSTVKGRMRLGLTKLRSALDP